MTINPNSFVIKRDNDTLYPFRVLSDCHEFIIVTKFSADRLDPGNLEKVWYRPPIRC